MNTSIKDRLQRGQPCIDAAAFFGSDWQGCPIKTELAGCDCAIAANIIEALEKRVGELEAALKGVEIALARDENVDAAMRIIVAHRRWINERTPDAEAAFNRALLLATNRSCAPPTRSHHRASAAGRSGIIRAITMTLAAVYVIGFIAVFCLHTQMPATLGLALARSFLWPLWITTGIPAGEHLPMD